MASNNFEELIRKLNDKPEERTLEILYLAKDTLAEEKNPETIAAMLSELAKYMSSFVGFAFQRDSQSLAAWRAILEFRDALASVAQTTSSVGVSLRAARLMQLMSVLLHRSTGPKTDDPIEAEEVNNSELEGAFKSIKRARDEEGLVCVGLLVGMLWRGPSLPVRLGIVNLLGRLGRQRPVYLSKIIPALIEQMEAEYMQDPTFAIHRRILCKTIESQLENLMEVTAAEKYSPLILDFLKKLQQSESAISAQKDTKRSKAGSDEEFGDEDDEFTLASAKKIRRLNLASNTLDITQISPGLATEIVLSTLLRTAISHFERALESWRPSTTTLAAVNRDPRRGRQEASAEKKTALPVEADQATEFHLKPRIIEEDEHQSLLKMGIGRVLRFEGDDLSRSIRLCFIFSKLLNEGSQFFEDFLTNFCLDEQALTERIELLMGLLGLYWVDGSVDERSLASYVRIYDKSVDRFLILVTSSSPLTEWSEVLYRFFSQVPYLPGDAHVTLFHSLCESPDYRIEGIQLIETLINRRPALIASFLGLLVKLFESSTDDSFRKHPINALMSLLSRPEYSKKIIDLAKDSLAVRDDVRGLDFGLQVALKDSTVWEYLCNVYPDYPLPVEQFLLQSLTDLASSIDLSLLHRLLECEIQDTPLGVFLERIFEMAVRNGLLKEQNQLVEMILEKMKTKKWPIRLLDRVLPFAANLEQQLGTCIVVFANTFDPTQETHKSIVLALLKKCADRFGGDKLLVMLHYFGDQVPLKRIIEYIQVCLTFMKAEVIMEALKVLVPMPDITKSNQDLLDELPPMLFRTLIQSFLLHKSLVGTIAGLLARLIEIGIWKSKLWEGFERCVKSLGMASFAALLQLPEDQLIGLLSNSSLEFKQAFSLYLGQQSIAIKNRFPTLLSSNKRSEEGPAHI